MAMSAVAGGKNRTFIIDGGTIDAITGVAVGGIKVWSTIRRRGKKEGHKKEKGIQGEEEENRRMPNAIQKFAACSLLYIV